MSAAERRARPRAAEALRGRQHRQRRRRAQSLRRRRARLRPGSAAVVETPGLTALDLPAAREVLLEDSLRARRPAPRPRRPDRRCRLGRRRARHPARATRSPTASSCCSTPSDESATSSRRGRPRTRASSGAGPRSSRPTGPAPRSRRRSRRPPIAAEWCLPLVRPGGVAVLWVGASPSRERRRARLRRRLGGELVDGAARAAGPAQARADAGRAFPRRTACRPRKRPLA